MKTKLIFSANLVIISILASCSCNKKQDPNLTTLNQNTATNKPQINIIDPFIDSEIDFSRALDYPTKNKKIKPKQNLKKPQQPISKKIKPKSKTKIKPIKNSSELICYNSGLKAQILRSGPTNGALPKKGQLVTTHYIGWHNENGQPGELIDSTYDRGLPFSFKIGLGQVVKAWDEGVMDMRIGDKRRLFIPAELGWGKAGVTKLIPGNTDLIYEIEVLAIK